MPAPLLLLAALAGAQMMGGGHHGHYGRQSERSGPAPLADRHAFISPMGEPFHVSGGDGLTAWFQQADRNHDGSITLEEMKQDAQRFYETLDTNRDGEIDPDEINHYETVIAPEVRSGASSFAAGDNVNDEATGGGRLGLLTIPEPVTAADTNLDRGISPQEFQTAAQTRFALLDRNGDGRLILSELEAMRSAVRSNARQARHPNNSDPDKDNGLPPIGGDSMPQ